MTTDERITFRCQYPNNCSCCPPNREAFVAVRDDAQRLQREQREDVKRMEQAAILIERGNAEIALLDQAVNIMAALHAACEPVDGDPEMAARVSPKAFRTFVDALVRLHYDRSQIRRATS
jgi:hypothetical protein